MIISFIKQQQVLDYFTYKNDPNDLVSSPFSSLDIGTYLPPTCGPLHSVLGPFRCPNAHKQHKKTKFLVVSDYFSYKNGLIDLVRGLFSSLDISTNNLPTCRPLHTFLGPFGGTQIPQNSIKKYFLVVLDYFSYKNKPIDLFSGFFSSLDIMTYILPTYGPLSTIMGPSGGAQMPQNSINTSFLAVLDHFSYYNGPIDWVRDPFSSLDTGTYISPTCGFVCIFLGPFGGT
jgi:hypothetical protein